MLVISKKKMLEQKLLRTVGKRAIGAILRLSSSEYEELRSVVFGKSLEEVDLEEVKTWRIKMLAIVDESLVDYYEQVIELNEVTTVIRLTRALYDLEKVMSQLQEA